MGTYVSPLVVNLPEASSIVGVGGFSFFVPNMRFMEADTGSRSQSLK